MSEPERSREDVPAMLLIPYALDIAGRRVAPGNARSHESYLCPECRGRLVFRKGAVKVPHFAHYGAPESCRFLSEGWLHVAAKHAIFHAVSEWAEGRANAPEILRRCERCREERWQPLPASIRNAAMESRLASGRVADLLLRSASGPVAVVEVFDTHAVDEDKERDLCGIPWVEIGAADALRDPLHWRPRGTGGLKPFRCRCVGALKMKIVYRGLALHVDYCPLPAHVWHGKAYANVIHDCSACQYLVGAIMPDEEREGSEGYVFCDAHRRKQEPAPAARAAER